jgi:hypothetical protein
MARISIVFWAALAVLAGAPAATAQQPGIVILDDQGGIDRNLLRKEHEELIKLLTEDPQAAKRAGLIRKTDYCLTCKGGTKANCTAPFGGETGKVWCASQCLYKCKSACRVAIKPC